MNFLNVSFENSALQILTSGAVVNFITVIIGSLLGLLFKKGIPERVKSTLMYGMALCVLYIGITGLFEDGANILVIIISFALGAVLGELADFDKMVNRLGAKLETKFSKGNSKIAEGFVTATLLFCVGAMTIVGSIESGINGDNSTLYSKSVIDGITAIALTSTFGIGVIFSSLSVLVIQGSLTLLAVFVAPVLTAEVVTQISVIGSALIIALALNLLGITKIKVMNYIPCLLLPIILCAFM